jgi:HEAT repeat protein
MPRALTAMLVLLVLGAPAAAWGTMHERVIAMLSAIESLPEQRQWLELGSEAAPTLTAIARDAEQPTFRRARALVVLGYFDSSAATDALEDMASDAAAVPSLRRHALLGLGRAAPARALPHLARALESDDVAMRQVAVKALRESASAEARALLRERLPREPRPSLLRQIEAALAD